MLLFDTKEILFILRCAENKGWHLVFWCFYYLVDNRIYTSQADQLITGSLYTIYYERTTIYKIGVLKSTLTCVSWTFKTDSGIYVLSEHKTHL